MGHRRPVAARHLARLIGYADHFVTAMARTGNLLLGERVKHADMALFAADQHDISRYRACCCLHVLGFQNFLDNGAAHMARRSVQNGIRKSDPPSKPSRYAGHSVTDGGSLNMQPLVDMHQYLVGVPPFRPFDSLATSVSNVAASFDHRYPGC